MQLNIQPGMKKQYSYKETEYNQEIHGYETARYFKSRFLEPLDNSKQTPQWNAAILCLISWTTRSFKPVSVCLGGWNNRDFTVVTNISSNDLLKRNLDHLVQANFKKKKYLLFSSTPQQVKMYRSIWSILPQDD